jgi:PHD/YefM family antitoxin component YafN of YafNO toxin-antitoxin module
MAEEKSLKEVAIAYGAMTADLERPLVLERDGQPFAVVLSFEEYQRLRRQAAVEEERVSWRERFESSLAEMRAHTAKHTTEEIEAEITAAFNEMRELLYGNRYGKHLSSRIEGL